MIDDGEWRERVTRVLYEELRHCCDGYVEHVPDGQWVSGSGVTFDGAIALDEFADFVISKFGLDQQDGNLA